MTCALESGSYEPVAIGSNHALFKLSGARIESAPRKRSQGIMIGTHLEIQDRTLYIRQLEIREPEVVDYISRLHQEEMEPAVVQALQVGVFCLQRAQVTQDTDFVRRQIERLLADVTQAVEKIPGMAEQAIVGKIGVENGQLLAPIHNLVTEVSRTTAGRLSDVRELLTTEIDPGKDSSTIGKALKTLKICSIPSGVTRFKVLSRQQYLKLLARMARSPKQSSVWCRTRWNLSRLSLQP